MKDQGPCSMAAQDVAFTTEDRSLECLASVGSHSPTSIGDHDSISCCSDVRVWFFLLYMPHVGPSLCSWLVLLILLIEWHTFLAEIVSSSLFNEALFRLFDN